MATYQVTGPDGATYRIDGPDDADPSAVISQITGHHRPQSLDLVNGQTVPTGSAAAKAAQSPVSDSDLENFRAGAGKATYDIGRGIGQMVGLTSRQDVADSRARDAALMKTKAGLGGDIAGTAVDMLPAALIPGAGTLGGAAAIGAGTGLLQPSTSTGETLKNTTMGAALSPAALLAGRGLGALYQGGKAALMPFLPGGTQKIAGQTLQSFAGAPAAAQAAAQELQNAPAVLPGVQPSMGELTSNPGLAQLQRTLTNNPETLTQMAGRDQANRGAIQNAIEQMAGTPADRAANVAARSAAARPLYEQAGSAQVEIDDQLNKILARPSMEKAWSRAEQLAAENDTTLTRPQMAVGMGRAVPKEGAPPLISGQALQYLKMGLQDITNTGPQNGIGAHEVGAMRRTLGDLNDWVTSKVPALRQADQAYAQASAPINQADIAGQLRDKLVPALGDFGVVPRMNANSFAQGVRGGDQIAADVTGNSRATLEGTLSPQQNQTIRQIGEQLARRANAADLGRAAGSNTAQNLAGQNVLRQILGPLGLPQSTAGRAAQSVLGQQIAKPYGWISSAAQPDVLQELSKAALDPRYAAQLLAKSPNSKIAQLLWARQGLLGPLGTTAGLAVAGSGNGAK